jgi:hypothetical protein
MAFVRDGSSPRPRVFLAEGQERLVRGFVVLLQEEICVQVVNCALHDRPHLVLSDVRIFRVAVAGWTDLSGMDILNGAIAKSQGHYRLGFPRNRRQMLGCDFRLSYHLNSDA